MDKVLRGTFGVPKDTPYPGNIVSYIMEHMPPGTENEVTGRSVLRGIRKVFSERELTVIEMRFRDKRTLEEIGNELGVTKERARTLLERLVRDMVSEESIKTFTMVPYKDYIEEVENRENLEKQVKELKGLLVKAGFWVDGYKTPLINMGLSNRSMNCLWRERCDTLGDLLAIPTYDVFMSIRNLGKKSAQEILDKVHSYGYKMRWERDDDVG